MADRMISKRTYFWRRYLRRLCGAD